MRKSLYNIPRIFLFQLAWFGHVKFNTEM